MDQVDDLIRSAIHEGVFPGAAYLIWHDGGVVCQGATGNFTYDPGSRPITLDSIWDLASVSKVIGTTSAMMLLVQVGKIDIEKPVASVIPEFGRHGKEHVTFRNLLVHDSGLIAFRPYQLSFSEPIEVMKAIYDEKLTYETGSKSVYSDLSMILLAEAINRLTGQSLDEFLSAEVFRPLGMNQTGYFHYDRSTCRNEVTRQDCAPTERTEPWRKLLREKRYGTLGSETLFGANPEFIQGEVHDPTATVLGGVAGHAGLFSTVGDICKFMANFVSSKPILFDTHLRDQFIRQDSSKSSRALGWDTKSPEVSSAGQFFGPRSFGHTGYTGTSIWCDPDTNLFVVLLSNRVHPTSENTRIQQFRPRFHDVVWQVAFPGN